jgi:hypothetical protein
MQDMMYGTEDLDVRSKMDNVARAIQTMHTVGQLSQLHNHRMASPLVWVSSYSAMLLECLVLRLWQEAGAGPHHAEPYHAVCLLGGDSQPD